MNDIDAAKSLKSTTKRFQRADDVLRTHDLHGADLVRAGKEYCEARADHAETIKEFEKHV